MTAREQALVIITKEVADNGRVTRYALRQYIENRMSRESFNAAVKQGMRLFEKRQKHLRG